MYEMPQSLLVANPINRYLINSPMLPSLVPDTDGGYTFYIQNESPGADKEVELAARAEGAVRRWCCGCTGRSRMRSTAPGTAPPEGLAPRTRGHKARTAESVALEELLIAYRGGRDTVRT